MTALLSPSRHQSLKWGPSPEELPEVALTEEKKLVTLSKSLHLSQPRFPHPQHGVAKEAAQRVWRGQAGTEEE